jgi:DNA-binding phage protein
MPRNEGKYTLAEFPDGVSQQQIQKLEGSDANPTLETLEKVARGLGLRLSVAIS